MAAGLPLVTSNVQGIPDYIENGITGFMCDHRDVEQFAENLKLLTENAQLRRTIGQTNVEFVKKYAVSRIQPRILELFENTSWEE